MPRSKRWEELGVKDGFGQVRVLKWRYFVDYVNQKMLAYNTYIWRGQRCDNWTLKSTLDRLAERARVAKTNQHDFKLAHLENFLNQPGTQYLRGLMWFDRGNYEGRRILLNPYFRI